VLRLPRLAGLDRKRWVSLDFCRQLPAEITDETIFSVPDDLPVSLALSQLKEEGAGCKAGRENSGSLASEL